MTEQDIAGKWGGFYIYGHGYPNEEQGITVGFDLEIFAENGLVLAIVPMTKRRIYSKHLFPLEVLFSALGSAAL